MDAEDDEYRGRRRMILNALNSQDAEFITQAFDGCPVWMAAVLGACLPPDRRGEFSSLVLENYGKKE